MIVLTLVVLGALVLIARRHRGLRSEPELPPELISADLVYAERTFRSARWSLVARLDRAYRTRDGLVLVELKTRNRNTAFMSDIIELSVQRMVLEEATGQKVSASGWVLVEHDAKRDAHYVPLLNVEQVMALRARHDNLVHGLIDRPNAAASLPQCASCGHRQRCARRFGELD